MKYDNAVTVKVLKGVKVNVEEVEKLDNDRQFAAEASKDLRLSITRVDPSAIERNSHTITMCG